MKRTREGKQEKATAAAVGKAPDKVQRMNRKQRRELVRKIQADDVSLEVVHPDAAGIDIGNECHYVAVPSKRDPEQPVRRFGCVTAELKTMAGVAQAVWDPDGGHAVHRSVLDPGVRPGRPS